MLKKPNLSSLCVLVLALATIHCTSLTLHAQTVQRPATAGKKDVDPGTPRDFRSQRFLLHADLSNLEAKDLLARLEKMYDLVGVYWGRQLKPGQVVEMWVVKDLNRWPKGSIPDEGLSHIQAGGGVTPIRARIARGPQGERVNVASQAICFAVYDRGTPLHEAVHAFCGLTFGGTGPVWYSEGMAEMGQYWRERDSSVRLDAGVLKYLQTNSVKSLNAIINNQEQTGDSWQNYCWRWALCHLLANNPNYRDKFRPLGLDLLLDHRNSFENVYGNMAAEISFEYKQFLATIENGARVDLTAIDWKKKFTPLHGKSGPSSSIAAGRGWQPTQAIVDPAKTYDYGTTGKWSIEKGAATLTADGDDERKGRLIGAILSQDAKGDYQLSKTFPLGSKGNFTPPSSGKLFVRCDDDWGQLADNQGKVTFKIKLHD